MGRGYANNNEYWSDFDYVRSMRYAFDICFIWPINAVKKNSFGSNSMRLDSPETVHTTSDIKLQHTNRERRHIPHKHGIVHRSIARQHNRLRCNSRLIIPIIETIDIWIREDGPIRHPHEWNIQLNRQGSGSVSRIDHLDINSIRRHIDGSDPEQRVEVALAVGDGQGLRAAVVREEGLEIV